MSNKIERLTQERDALKGDNLRLKHRISYLEEVRHDDELAEEDAHKDKSSSRTSKNVQNQSTQQQHDSLSSGESQSVYRSEIRVQGAPVRQKPPRNSKLKTNGNGNSMGRQHPTVPEIDYADSNKRMTSSLDMRRTADEPTNNGSGVVIETGSMSRIKPSIVDRHFGHVIRVTHHHHPHHQANQHAPPASSSSASSHDYASRRQRVPADSISVSDLQSVASYDSFVDPHPIRHHHMGQSMETVSNGSLMVRSFNQRSPPSPTRVMHVKF